MNLKDFNEILNKELTDPEFALAYLKIALEENGIEGFSKALHKTIAANKSTIDLTENIDRIKLDLAFRELDNIMFNSIDDLLQVLESKISNDRIILF